MYDISGLHRNGWQDTLSADEARREALSEDWGQRWKDVDAGEPELTPTFPAEVPEGLDPITSEFFEYYVAARGHHPRSIGGFTLTSAMSHIDFGQVSHLDDICPGRSC